MRLVDRGKQIPNADVSQLRSLDQQFYKTPILSVCCELSDIQPKYHAYTSKSAKYFKELVENRSMYARIKGINNTVGAETIAKPLQHFGFGMESIAIY